ncbi:MAG: L-seryl-tRNA(Sec) selenium transferase [Jatrophihabitans sp.]|uniref:L-seryl-tRNA(Sec) selenium transferase n=1 Tax=Jatrophihabitans sp. TaxID=1932789 RepID=UPI003F81541E
MTDPRRHLPRTDAVLAEPVLAAAAARLDPAVVKRAVVERLAAYRAAPPATAPDAAQVAAEVAAALPRGGTTLRRVINATGVVLHTNLGRAPLSSDALRAVAQAAGYVDVEFDLADGRRAARGRGTLEALRRALPDAGDVHVVNNGAAALVLATTALAAGREVIVSRGELVEIGDGFRLPDLIESTGARLREVGTTNRVTLDDYAAAIGPDTGCVLKVHPSNFRIEGFTRAVEVDRLTTLPVPVVVDVGSGLLAPDPLLPDEPDVTTALRAGAAVVTCSGDKLLGGPQAGLLAGQAAVVQRLRRHPLARALRVDKLTLAALEASLTAPTPVHAFLHADADDLNRRCVRLAESVGGVVVASDGVVGGGGAPGLTLPGWAVALPEFYAAALRAGEPPVVGRVEHGRCLLDLRCVDPADDDLLVAAVGRVRDA